MWIIIVALLVLGVLLLVAEGFIPGLVVGIIGALSLIAATVLAYTYYGPTCGSLLLLGEIISGVLFTLWWLRYAPRSKFARRWTLHATVRDLRRDSDNTLIGAEGEALSPLRPAGVAEINGSRLDVVSEGDLIASGERIRVIKVEGRRIVVRKHGNHPKISA